MRTCSSKARVAMLAVLLGSFVFVAPCLGAPVQAKAPAGSVGIYFDTDYTQSDLFDPPTLTSISFWVVVKGITEVSPSAKLSGYELQLDVPAELIVTGKTMNPLTSINIGDPNINEWIVGTGACLSPDGNGNIQILTYTFLLTAPAGQNRVISFGPTDPSSFTPPAPGWLECGETLYTFSQTVPGRINPVVCDVVDASFDGTTVRGLDADVAEVFATDVGKTVQGVLVNDFDADGDNNVLYWTASDGAEAGTVGQLNCQGEVVWSFTQSGLTCQPTAGLVDVTAVEVGDFYADNPGDELLVLSRQNDANDVPVLRLDLLDLEGTLLGPSNNFEYWVLGDMPVYRLTVDGSGNTDVLVGGQDNATGDALVMRLPVDNLRGAGPVAAAGCTAGTEEATAVWSYVLGANNGTIDPYFQQESMVAGLTVATGLITVNMESGNSYELDDTLLPLPCELVSVTTDGSVVSGLDSSSQVLWTYDIPDGADAVFADVVPVGANPAAVIGIANTGALGNSVLALECHGKPACFYDGQVANCFGDPDGAPLLESVERGTAGTTVANRFFARYLYPSANHTRLTVLSLGNNVRTITAVGTYDLPGPVQATLFGDGDGDTVHNLYVGFHNTLAGGYAHVLAFDAADLSGSAADGTGSCGPGSQLWSALFDGVTHPVDPGDVLSVEILAKRVGTIQVTTSNDVYLLDATTGELLGPGCDVDPTALDFGSVEVGQSATRDFTITNNGTDPLAGEVVSPCGDFSVVGDATYDLAPTEFKTFTVSFAPQVAGNQQCILDTGSEVCSDVTAVGSGFVFGNVGLTVETVTGVAAGTEVSLSVDGTAMSGVAGLEGVIHYDGGAFTLVEAALGQLLVDAGGFTVAFNTTVPGEIAFAIARATGLDPSHNEGAVIDLTFDVDADAMPGTYAVSFSEANAYDENADPLSVLPVDGAIEVACRLFDVTGDGEVHSNDAILTLRIDGGLLSPTPAQECAADVDGDGEVTAGDAVAILRYVVGLPVLEPPAGMAKATRATLVGDGEATRLADGTVAIPLAVTSDAVVAGLDLSFALSADAAYGGISLVEGDGALVTRVDGNVVTVAAASATGLGSAGTARLELRVRPQPGARTVTLTVVEGRAFDVGSRGIDLDNDTGLVLALDAVANVAPLRSALLQNNPNPFNPRTEIRFRLAAPATIDLGVYDVSGRRIATLVSGHRDAGEHRVVWEGLDATGRPVASGVYIYRLEAPGVSDSKRMILVR